MLIIFRVAGQKTFTHVDTVEQLLSVFHRCLKAYSRAKTYLLAWVGEGGAVIPGWYHGCKSVAYLFRML